MFALVPDRVVPPDLRPFATVDEVEGLTPSWFPAPTPTGWVLAYDYVAARITLRVHSDPAAVGMTPPSAGSSPTRA